MIEIALGIILAWVLIVTAHLWLPLVLKAVAGIAIIITIGAFIFLGLIIIGG